MTTINITEITDGSPTGEGYFDKMMASITEHIETQHKANRISSADYSVVYLGALQSALAQAVQFALGRQQASGQADLLAQKKITEITQTVDATGGTAKKQQDLILAQTEGFARDAEQKLAKIVSDAYAVQRTTDNALAPPTSLDAASIDSILAIAKDGIDGP